MRTKGEITMDWGPAHSRVRTSITIPAGTLVKSCEDGTGQYFVDHLGWLDGKAHPLTLHDAIHYGIRLDADQVEP